MNRWKGINMNEFKKIIRKKGISKTITYAILILIMLLPLIILHKPIIGSFQGTCVATNYKELQKCQKAGRPTKIKTTNIYDVAYNYVVDNKVVGKFLDVDLEGHVILTLADITTADELLNQTGEREISGHFTKFHSKVFKDARNKIENDYIERFTVTSGTITKEQTKGMFFPYLLNQYDGEGFPYIIPVIIIGIIIILLLFKLIEGIKMIIKPERLILYKRKMMKNDENIEKASFELQNGPYLFQNKNIKITNNYIFDMKGFRFTYHKVNEVFWAYEQKIKRYGLVETGTQLIIKFKDKTTYVLALNLTERKKVMEILRVKNPKLIKGYSQEAEEQFKKITNK